MGCCRLSRLGCCQDADEGGGRATAGDVGVKEEEEEEEVPQGRCLNLTGCHLHDLGDVDIPEDLVELDLTDNRISKLDPRIGHLAQLRKLSLERNLFDDEDVYPISRWHTVDGLIVKPSILSFLVFKSKKSYVFPSCAWISIDLKPAMDSK